MDNNISTFLVLHLFIYILKIYLYICIYIYCHIVQYYTYRRPYLLHIIYPCNLAPSCVLLQLKQWQIPRGYRTYFRSHRPPPHDPAPVSSTKSRQAIDGSGGWLRGCVANLCFFSRCFQFLLSQVSIQSCVFFWLTGKKTSHLFCEGATIA